MSYSAQRATCIGLWEDCYYPGRFFRVSEVTDDGYLALGHAWGESVGDRPRQPMEPWSCRTALLLRNYHRVFRTPNEWIFLGFVTTGGHAVYRRAEPEET